jgi:hypothetical protein
MKTLMGVAAMLLAPEAQDDHAFFSLPLVTQVGIGELLRNYRDR